jgi:hypothetical protein
MKYLFTFMLLLAFIAGCKPRVISGVELETKLKETMQNYLDTTLRPEAKATIKDVVYFPERSKSSYICEFHVNLHFGNRDTTGVMTAIISNDFKKVERRQ